MKKLHQYRTQLEQAKGARKQLISDLAVVEERIEKQEQKQKHLEKAQVIIQTVAKMTQEQLEYHISEIVSLALTAVFPDPYKLNVDFVLKRNQTEAILTFSRDDKKIDPLCASGGGVVNVAAFSLRISLWSLCRPRSRNVIIMDEPFLNVSHDLQDKVSQIIKEISKRLNLQMIIVSHETNLIESVDKVFEVKMKKRISHVSCS